MDNEGVIEKPRVYLHNNNKYLTLDEIFEQTD